MLRTSILIFSLLILSSCNPPHVDTCEVDLFVFEAGLNSVDFTKPKQDVIKEVLNLNGELCAPFNTPANIYYRPFLSGDHVYSSKDWNTLMTWINNHGN